MPGQKFQKDLEK